MKAKPNQQQGPDPPDSRRPLATEGRLPGTQAPHAWTPHHLTTSAAFHRSTPARWPTSSLPPTPANSALPTISPSSPGRTRRQRGGPVLHRDEQEEGWSRCMHLTGERGVRGDCGEEERRVVADALDRMTSVALSSRCTGRAMPVTLPHHTTTSHELAMGDEGKQDRPKTVSPTHST